MTPAFANTHEQPLPLLHYVLCNRRPPDWPYPDPTDFRSYLQASSKTVFLNR